MSRPWLPVGISLIVAAGILFLHYGWWHTFPHRNIPPVQETAYFFLAFVAPPILCGVGVTLCGFYRNR